MYLFEIYLTLLFSYTCTGIEFKELPSADPKILGGDNAPNGAIKYQVSLQNMGNHFCGGSIIDPKWVITAAHCMVNRPACSFQVVVGINKLSDEGKQYTRDKIIVHEKFDNKLFVNDVSLIKLDPGIELNSRVQPIGLPLTNTNEGDTLTLTGWGKTSGDSGGPLVSNGTLAALVSWGTGSCGHSMQFPDVNTRIYYFSDWIKDTMKKN